MTGRAAGYCAGFAMPGYANPVTGRGFGTGFGGGRGFGGRGFGAGRGRRNWYYATGLPGWVRAGAGYPAFGAGSFQVPAAPVFTRGEEVDALQGQADWLEGQLGSIRKRIEELSAQEETKA
jgi:hypothetical protein